MDFWRWRVASMEAGVNALDHTKEFWDICARLGLGNGCRDNIFPPLQEQIERIEEVHDPYPGAVWRYEWPEALT